MAKNILLSIIKDPAIRGRVILLLTVIAIMVFAIILSGPKPIEPEPIIETTVLSTPENSNPIKTPTSYEELAEVESGITTGVIVGTAGILLIILAGTILELRRNA